MAVPSGVTVVTVNINPPDGVSPRGLRVRLTPTIDLSWSANGQALGTMLPAVRSGVVSLKVPATDQVGFLTRDGQPFRFWSYVLTIEGALAGVPISTTRVLSLPASPAVVDLSVFSAGGGSVELPSYLAKSALDNSYAPVDDPRFDAIGGSPISVVDNGNGTITIDDGGSGALVDNGNGTATLTV